MRYKKNFSLNFNLNNNLSYLSGALIGDGHLYSGTKSKTDKSKDYRISFELIDKEYVKFLLESIKKEIETKSKIRIIKDKRKNRKLRYQIAIKNKWLFLFFRGDLKIPEGKKSEKVKIPSKINSDSHTKQFIAGLYDTDGGKRGHTIGFTSKSKNLIENTSKILNNFKISHLRESWINKKYNSRFYGIRLHKKSIDKFLNEFPIQNKSRCGDAGVWKTG